MNIIYWKEHNNFGDEMNEWIWEYLFPSLKKNLSPISLVGIGTLLNADFIPDTDTNKKIVIGSGTGYGVPPNINDEKLWDIRCVRGPMTADRLGLPNSKAIIDPAVIVADMPEFQNLKKKYAISFVPHWVTKVHGKWDVVCDKLDIKYINPCDNSKVVIKEIAQSRIVIAESMHAAIIADAFRIPWIPVSTSSSINSFKWQDWLCSINMEYTPAHLPFSSPLEVTGKGYKYCGISWPKPRAETYQKHGIGNENNSSNSSLKQHLKTLLNSTTISNCLMLPAIKGMKKVKQIEPYLSKDGVLDSRKTRFYEVIKSISIDYEI